MILKTKVALSTIIFQTEILPLNAAGIVVVLSGSAYYSYVSITDNNIKNAKKEESTTEVVQLQTDDVDGDEENLMDGETAPLTGKKDTND